MRFKRSIPLLAALILLLTVVAPASAITWGQPDGDDHPHVVQLLFVQDGEGFFGCSGTLLTPTLVLTAGHCAGWLDDEGNLQPNDVTYVSNETDIAAFLAATRPNYPTTTAWLEAEWVGGDAQAHPEYAEYADFPNTFDIGVVVLEEPINVSVYGALPAEGQFDYLRTAKLAPSQRMVEVVGYGLVGAIPAFADDEIWERRVGYSTIINTGRSGNVGPQNFMFTNNPGKGSGVGGTCSGDSGGPAFWIDPATGQPTNVVVAVNSYGIAPNCNGNDYQFRADTDVALDFLAEFLP